MKCFLLSIVLVLLAGCDRDITPANGANDPANAEATQGSPTQKSDTLKITYSKSDPLKKAPAKDGPSKAHVHDHSAPTEKPKDSADKKTEHKEHDHK